MDKTATRLKGKARDLIEDSLEEAVSIGNQRDYDRRYKAKRLLERLEPVIFAYAPPPDRIVKALKYGNQRPPDPC
jgi:hypothetical protein